MPIAGPDYKCYYADIGSNGQMNDSGVWNSPDLRRKIEDNCFNIPAPTLYVFEGDDAFPLKSYMLKPYPQTDLTPNKRV